MTGVSMNSTPNLSDSHRLNCAFFTVCQEICFSTIQGLLFHQCSNKIDLTLALLRSSHRGRHKHVLSARTFAEFMQRNCGCLSVSPDNALEYGQPCQGHRQSRNCASRKSCSTSSACLIFSSHRGLTTSNILKHSLDIKGLVFLKPVFKYFFPCVEEPFLYPKRAQLIFSIASFQSVFCLWKFLCHSHNI